MPTKLDKQIADLKAAIASPATPDAQKEVMKGVLQKLEAKQQPKNASKPKPAPKAKKTTAAKTEEVVDDDDEPDLFEEYEKQPPELAAIVEKWGDKAGGDPQGLSYKQLAAFQKDVEKIGYTFEYGLDANPFGLRKLKPNKGKVKKQPKAKKSSEPKELYDCSDLIEKEKAKKAKAKETAAKRANEPKKTEATKNADAIDKVTVRLEKSIEKRIEDGKVPVAELEKLIKETEEMLGMLKNALDSVKRLKK